MALVSQDLFLSMLASVDSGDLDRVRFVKQQLWTVNLDVELWVRISKYVESETALLSLLKAVQSKFKDTEGREAIAADSILRTFPTETLRFEALRILTSGPGASLRAGEVIALGKDRFSTDASRHAIAALFRSRLFRTQDLPQLLGWMSADRWRKKVLDLFQDHEGNLHEPWTSEDALLRALAEFRQQPVLTEVLSSTGKNLSPRAILALIKLASDDDHRSVVLRSCSDDRLKRSFCDASSVSELVESFASDRKRLYAFRRALRAGGLSPTPSLLYAVGLFKDPKRRRKAVEELFSLDARGTVYGPDCLVATMETLPASHRHLLLRKWTRTRTLPPTHRETVGKLLASRVELQIFLDSLDLSPAERERLWRACAVEFSNDVAGGVSTNLPEEEEDLGLRKKLEALRSVEDEKSNEETPASELCVVCLDRKRIVAFQCGHYRFCAACSRELLKTGSPCPECRAPIERAFKVFA